MPTWSWGLRGPAKVLTMWLSRIWTHGAHPALLSAAPCQVDSLLWLLASLWLPFGRDVPECLCYKAKPSKYCRFAHGGKLQRFLEVSPFTSGGRIQTQVAVKCHKPCLPLHRRKGNGLDFCLSSVRTEWLVKITDCRTYNFSVRSQLPLAPPNKKEL